MPPRDPMDSRDSELLALQTAFDEYIASSRELEDELDAELAKMRECAPYARARLPRPAALALRWGRGANLPVGAVDVPMPNAAWHFVAPLCHAVYMSCAARLCPLPPLPTPAHQILLAPSCSFPPHTHIHKHTKHTPQPPHPTRSPAEEKLSETSGHNATLSFQIEEMQPQISSLEKALHHAREELAKEREMRRSSDLREEDAEARAREAEAAAGRVKTELEDAMEILAFREEELEEVRLELEVERERFEAEIREAQEDQSQGAADGGAKGEKKEWTGDGDDDDDDANEGGDGGAKGDGKSEEQEDGDYVSQLEDELENVTEQLIAAESRASELEGSLNEAREASEEASARLSETEERLAEAKAEAEGGAAAGSSGDGPTSEEAKALRQQVERQKEELELTTEELTLVQEEMKAAEEDLKAANETVSAVRAEHKVEVAKLAEQVVSARADASSAEAEAEALRSAVKGVEEETTGLRDEIDALNKALENAKADRDKTIEEMDVLKAAFDTTEQQEHLAAGEREEDLRKTLTKNHAREVEELKEEIGGLTETNTRLKKMIDELKKSQAETLEKAAAASTAEVGDAGAMREAKLVADLDKAMADLKLRGDEADIVRVDMERQVERATKELKVAEDELEAVKSQLAETTEKLTELEASNKRKAEVESLQGPKQSAVPQARHLADEDEDVEGDETNVEKIIESGDPELMAEELRSLSKVKDSFKEHNANLLKKILGLQGNIQVACRVRPITEAERKEGRGVVEPLSETDLGCFDERTKTWKSYAFDKVWGPDTSQRGVFQDVEPLALSVVDGYNACIFAYGQTGSGKTYTMEGIKEGKQFGISHRTIKKLFTLLHLRQQQQEAAANAENIDPADDSAVGVGAFVFDIEVGMLEIYNDEIYDLLGPPQSKGGKKSILDVRRGSTGLIEIPDLKREKVQSLQAVMKLLARGNTNRATATTNMNEHSSRSHMILQVRVSSGIEGQPTSIGNLYLIDLAGSERVRRSEVDGEHLKEAGHINKSLSALGNVFEALDRKAKHVPYRDSKLTYLLQDALGGNSRTLMVLNVSPTGASYDETTCALQFGTRARRINVGTAKKNVASKNLEETVNKLSSELKLLSKAKQRSEQQMSSLKKENQRVQERLKSSAASRAKSSDDSRTMSVLKKTNADITERWKKEKFLREKQANETEELQQSMQKIKQETAKLGRQVGKLSTEVSEKDNKIVDLQGQLRTAKDKASAANLRARTSQIIAPRPSTSRAKQNGGSSPARSVRPKPRASSKTPEQLAEIRSKVEALMKKHDPSKIDRVDSIMEKFKGRETYMLTKMKQKYEGGGIAPGAKNGTSNGSGSKPSPKSTAKLSAQERSSIAMKKHMDRMKSK